MTARCAIAVVVVGALALGGCGGESSRDGSVAASAGSTTPTQPAVTVPPASTTPGPATTAPPRAPRRLKATPRRQPAPRVESKSATTPRRSSRRPSKPATTASAPLTCLAKARLVKARKSDAGVWRANDRVTGRPVLVDGPYKTPAEAKTSADSLAGVESAEGGGRFVVSAALRSRLDSRVRAVANCLDGRG